MKDGIYYINVTLTGGTGKAGISSPAQITVSDGNMTARVEWSSSKYDLMIVGGEEFLPVNESGNSVFEIPVYTLDEPLSVQAETVAMSEPHLIDYEIGFDSSSLKNDGADITVPIIAGSTAFVCITAVIAAVIMKNKKRKKKNETQTL